MHINTLADLIGKRVVVTADHGTLGYLVAKRHLSARRLAAVGIVGQLVPGHGGDVVTVYQEDTPPGAEPVAVYCHLNELEFYSEAALAFATQKANAVREMEKALTHLKELPFSQENLHEARTEDQK